MDEIRNDITLLKYIYEKTNDSDFIKHSFEIYFPIIFKYMIDHTNDIDIDSYYEFLNILEKYFNNLEN